MYKKTKFGFFSGHEKGVPATSPASEAAMRAFKAAELYPHNYYFPEYVAKLAFEKASFATPHAGLDDESALKSESEYKENIKNALYYSEVALSLNPNLELARKLYAHSLAEKGEIDKAISFWETQVVDREFWNFHNHDFLARFYLRASDPESLEKAVREIPLVGDAELRKELTELKKLIGR